VKLRRFMWFTSSWLRLGRPIQARAYHFYSTILLHNEEMIDFRAAITAASAERSCLRS
jgi:hypothetical protein